jgi:hypothetical protein
MKLIRDESVRPGRIGLTISSFTVREIVADESTSGAFSIPMLSIGHYFVVQKRESHV